MNFEDRHFYMPNNKLPVNALSKWSENKHQA